MEIPAGPPLPTLPTGSGLTLGVSIPLSVEGLPQALLRPQVIEAVALRNSPLLPQILTTPSSSLPAQQAPLVGTASTVPPNTPPLTAALLQSLAQSRPQNAPPLPNLPLLHIAANADTPPQVRVLMQWQGQTFEVMSARPLPLSVPLRVQVTPRQELILRENLPPAPPSAPLQPTTPREQALQAVPTLVRENLPRQQPLTVLLPALRTLIAPEQQAKLPPPLARAILNLWQALPVPKQLQQPQVLQKLLRESGSFFEANTATARATPEQPAALPRVLGTDIKAQIAVLLTLLRSRPTTAPTSAHAPQSSAPIANNHTPAAEPDVIYQKPLPRHDLGAPTPRADEGATEPLLQQLGKALEASLSRIHLNQLDTIVSRHTGPDPAAMVPTWVVELPVRTQHGYEQIHVRIEEHASQQEQQQKKQWIVQLGFDLHEFGKLSATLSIIERSVAATLWAEHETTHRTVQHELTSLRDGLEAAGVNVTEMTCRQGLAPERSALVRQRLVDTHS